MSETRNRSFSSVRPTGRAKKQLFLNYKGGTGKTSISAAYAHYLAAMGKRILMVDLDAQGHLTTCMNLEDRESAHSLYSVIVKGRPVSDIIVPTYHDNIKLVPSSISISALEEPLFNMSLKEFQLRKALKSLERDYDYIIIDPAPSISLLGLNAIMASDDILVPLLADFLSFHGLKVLLETLSSVERDFRVSLGRIRIFLNRYNSNYDICKECREAVHKFYPDYALNSVINESPAFMDASGLGKSIFEIENGAEAIKDVENLAREINGW